MSMKCLTAALLAASFLSAPALAQSAQNPAASNAQAPMQKLGAWRTSKLIGLNVYNANNEKIGDINEIITEPSGKFDMVVIGVGGFLGMGERNVGVSWSQLKFVMEPRSAVAASSSTTKTETTGAGTPVATTTVTTTMTGNRDVPDHAVMNMTKQQLEALPAFKYLSDASSTTSRTTSTPAR